MDNASKVIFAIIIGVFIIGAFVYSTIKKIPVTIDTHSSVASNMISQEKVSAALPAKCQVDDTMIVTKVVDGDTVIVEGGQHVRLLGIDADEKNYPCYDGAKTRLEALVLNKPITLVKDKTDVDQYGRCLRAIFLGNQNIDLQLVKEGLAVARFYEPDTKYQSAISAAEKQAMENNVGCKWSK